MALEMGAWLVTADVMGRIQDGGLILNTCKNRLPLSLSLSIFNKFQSSDH